MPTLIVCEHCDTVYQRAPLQPGQRARCLRCAAPLYRADLAPPALLALTLAAAVVFLIANVFPIVSLDLQGSSSQSTLWGAIHAAWDSEVGPVAVLVALTAFFFPLLQILLLGAVLLALRRGGLRRSLLVDALHSLRFLRPWSMVEVFLLGALVAVVKMGALAAVQPRPGLYGFAALTLLLTALNSFDLHRLWECLDE
ncbi:paraquat-inducible protein A [Solimonas aquatica]|uniref:Paraquat-inducible protein A n=1 Tax=Solimonas aquatica TaxID=489703 RepID=A0A1H9IHD4_9GAMM|nr:paraquat-inducible protein A [Solimonas aquatica]SEQ73976.1 paraquat-inducible protein A [Solimonas aquatica]